MKRHRQAPLFKRGYGRVISGFFRELRAQGEPKIVDFVPQMCRL